MGFLCFPLYGAPLSSPSDRRSSAALLLANQNGVNFSCILIQTAFSCWTRLFLVIEKNLRGQILTTCWVTISELVLPNLQSEVIIYSFQEDSIFLNTFILPICAKFTRFKCYQKCSQGTACP